MKIKEELALVLVMPVIAKRCCGCGSDSLSPPLLLPSLPHQESWPQGHENKKASPAPSLAIALGRAVPTVELDLMAKAQVNYHPRGGAGPAPCRLPCLGERALHLDWAAQ